MSVGLQPSYEGPIVSGVFPVPVGGHNIVLEQVGVQVFSAVAAAAASVDVVVPVTDRRCRRSGVVTLVDVVIVVGLNFCQQAKQVDVAGTGLTNPAAAAAVPTPLLLPVAEVPVVVHAIVVSAVSIVVVSVGIDIIILVIVIVSIAIVSGATTTAAAAAAIVRCGVELSS